MVAALDRALALVVDQDLPGIRLVRGDGRQQCVPAVDSGFGVQYAGVEVPGQDRGAVLVAGDGPAQAGGDAAPGGDDTDPGDDLLPGPVVATAGRSGELVQVLGGLGQTFAAGGLPVGGVRGGVDQDPSHGERRIALAGPGQGVGVLQHAVGLAQFGGLAHVAGRHPRRPRTEIRLGRPRTIPGRTHAHTPLDPAPQTDKGAVSPGRTSPDGLVAEPDDHAFGRSRGGLTTKIHLAVDASSRVLAIVVTAGQRADTPVFAEVMARIRVPRIGGGYPRTPPAHVLAGRAYSSRKIRESLRRRQAPHTIPEKRDQVGHRRRRGSAGGRPPGFDREKCKARHKVECRIGLLKQARGVATRYEKLAVRFEAATQLTLIRQAL